MITPEQIYAVLSAVKTKPAWPASVDVPGLNPYDANHQHDKVQLFQKLHTQGFLEFVRGPAGRRTGLGYQCTPKGLAELNLLKNIRRSPNEFDPPNATERHPAALLHPAGQR